MNLEVLTAQEYKKKLRSKYWIKDFEKTPDMWGISFLKNDKAYVIIDNITKVYLGDKYLIDCISRTCVHELIHLANIGCKELSEKKVLKLERLLTGNRKSKINTVVIK